MLGFAPIGSGPIAGSNSAALAAIAAALAWTEGSEAEAVVAALAVTAALAWTEGSEAEAATEAVGGLPSRSAAIAWTEGAETFYASSGRPAPTTIPANRMLKVAAQNRIARF